MATEYTITDLLEGKYYRSHSLKRRGLEGIIQYAEKRENIYFHNAEAYLVTVRPTYRGFPDLPKEDFYATIAVKVGE